MAEPPLSVGALQLTSADAVSEMAEVAVGAPGAVNGVAVPGFDAVPLPTALSARTFTVYVVPLVRPLIVNGLDSVPAFVQVPLLFSSYSSADTGEPPSSGIENVTPIAWFCAVSEMIGALGGAAGPTLVVVEATLTPAAFTARTSIG